MPQQYWFDVKSQAKIHDPKFSNRMRDSDSGILITQEPFELRLLGIFIVFGVVLDIRY